MNDVEPMRTLSIVVPLYNEQHNIQPLYDCLTAVLNRLGESYEIIFVDDGSGDGTPDILEEIYENDRRVRVIRLRRNFGQTAALKAGFDFARGDIIISMDGDLQHDPEEIPQFLSKMAEGYDIVSGWRVVRKDAWLTRRLPSRIANWMMSKLSGVPLHDFGTTFKAYRAPIIQNINLYGELHRFIPAMASWMGATVAEVPIKNSLRQRGQSNYGISRTVRVLLDMLTIKFLLGYSIKPLHFFGPFGLLASGLGTLLGLFLLVKKIFWHEAIMVEHGPLLLTIVLLVLGGIQFLSLGLLGEMLARVYFESQGKPIYAVREVKSHQPTDAAPTRESTWPAAQVSSLDARGGNSGQTE